MFLAKVTWKSVKPEIYHMSYFLTLLTPVYNQGIFMYNLFPCIFATLCELDFGTNIIGICLL